MSYSNFEALLAVDVQKFARMLFFPESNFKIRANALFSMFQENNNPSKSQISEKIGADFSSVASPSLPDSADTSVLPICFE